MLRSLVLLPAFGWRKILVTGPSSPVRFRQLPTRDCNMVPPVFRCRSRLGHEWKSRLGLLATVPGPARGSLQGVPTSAFRHGDERQATPVRPLATPSPVSSSSAQPMPADLGGPWPAGWTMARRDLGRLEVPEPREGQKAHCPKLRSFLLARAEVWRQPAAQGENPGQRWAIEEPRRISFSPSRCQSKLRQRSTRRRTSLRRSASRSANRRNGSGEMLSSSR
jgi:hypothetical protein